MITLTRDKVVTDEVVKGTLKNYSYNNSGQLFLIFNELGEISIPATKGKKKIKIKFDKTTDKEILISLTAEETRKLKRFLNGCGDCI